MTYIKICGITNREDANLAIDFGADALGFIGIRESPRYVSALDFQRILDIMPRNFPAVVLVKRLADAEKYRSDYVQYYEESDLEDNLSASVKKLKVFRIHDESDINEAIRYDRDDAVVLDKFHASLLGGSGERFDWSLLKSAQASFNKPFILAGGLNGRNVTDAIEIARPYAVDVSSGVEESKTVGKKDSELMRRFIAAVRTFDQERSIVNRGEFLKGAA